ncbi:glycosyltransferase family 4 protein [Halomonas mongoliensis]|uniref:glycosyltransferase family 4 protein n=1 Tax=Halomonas mongoliensis TaxID=321265 RepID=UPI00403AABA7
MGIDVALESGRVDILFVAANARSLVHNRGDLIAGLIEEGYSVAALVPEYDYSEEVDALGIRVEKYDLDRHSLNPLKFLKQYLSLARKIQKISPSSVFCYAVKPIIMGSFAARMLGVKNVFCLVTGLGYAFCADGLKPKIVRYVARQLYGCASLLSAVFIFQNEFDKEELEKGWLFRLSGKLGKKRLVVPGSGVDVEKYAYSRLDLSRFSFICMARLIKEKGVFEYAEAARIVKEEYPEVEFYLAGELDEKLVSSVQKDDLEKWQSNCGVVYIGKVDDVKSWLGKSSFFVLPSYREGTSRAILEAMSIGRPVITTDVPGCNGPVVDGLNGFIVPPRDSGALSKAMKKILKDKEIIISMSEESRKRAVEVYDVKKVNQGMISVLRDYLP